MAIVTQMIVLLVVFLIFFWADARASLLSDMLLFLFFLWGMVAFDLTPIQASFYPIALLFYLIYKFRLGFKTNAKSGGIGNFQYKGVGFQIFTIVVGLGILSYMYFVESLNTLSVVGVPTLAISTGAGFKSAVTLMFAPTISASLGIIENRLFFTIFKVFSMFKEVIFFPLVAVPGLIVFGPAILTGLIFGFFHVIAYSVSVLNILWASSIMVLWIGTFILLQDDTPANTSHYWWNGTKTISDALQIAS